jgi:hypothetical protein
MLKLVIHSFWPAAWSCHAAWRPSLPTRTGLGIPPPNSGDELQCLENAMRSCNIVFRLALRGYSAAFVCGSIVAFTAGRLAFVAARGGRHPSPVEIVDSIRPASSASAKSPVKAADSFRPAPSAPHPDNSRSRRHSRRRLAREAAVAASAKAAAEADRLRQVEIVAAEDAAAQRRQVEIAAAEEAAAQRRQVEIAAAEEAAAVEAAAAEEAAAQRRQVEFAAAEEAAAATQRGQEETGAAAEAAQRRQVSGVGAQAAHLCEGSDTVVQAAQRRRDAIDRLRREAALAGTARRWQWARIDGRLSRSEAQRRQDAIDALQHEEVIVFTSPTTGVERLRWGRFDGRSPGRGIRPTEGLPTVAVSWAASEAAAASVTGSRLDDATLAGRA